MSSTSILSVFILGMAFWSKSESKQEPGPVAPLHAVEQKGVSFLTASDDFISSRGLVYTKASQTDRANNSIVMACCLWAGRNIQQAPVSVYQETADGWEIVPGHQAALLLRKPQATLPPDLRNKFNGRQLLSSILISAMLTGDAYVHKIRNGSGKVIALDYYPAHTVTPRVNSSDARRVDYYEVNQNKGTLKLPPEDMITFPLFGLDEDRPYRGRDILKAVARQIVTDNKIGQYSESIMDSPNPRLMIAAKGARQPKQEEADRVQNVLSQSMGGKNSGRALITTFEADVTPFSFSPDQMAIGLINQLPETRICAIYGIPPTAIQLMAGLEHSTYSNMKEAREAATEEFLVPMWDAIAEVWSEHLLPEMDKNQTLEIRFNKSEVRALQEDKDALHKRSREDFRENIVNRAEARTAIGQEPQPGDENVYAWMLKPTPMPAVPQGPEDAKKVRAAAENGK